MLPTFPFVFPSHLYVSTREVSVPSSVGVGVGVGVVGVGVVGVVGVGVVVGVVGVGVVGVVGVGVGVGVSSIAIFVCASSIVDAFDFLLPHVFAHTRLEAPAAPYNFA